MLLADRPLGKPYAGYWEFPGGKIEPGEGVASALERELFEELGIVIGSSVPWLTFEFDYPHAYVELQFRVVREWRGDPHAREGQQLGFFDPAGPLPRPLLPAAVPALRWLLLPRTVFVTDLPGAAAAAADPRQIGRGDDSPIVVVDSDWSSAGAEEALAAVRAQWTSGRPRLLASGGGAQRLAGADGAVLEAGAMARPAEEGGGLYGAWVSCAAELKAAARGCFDFVLVRSAALAEELRAHPAPLPAYLPSDLIPVVADAPADLPGQGRWIDLRSAVAPAAATEGSDRG